MSSKKYYLTHSKDDSLQVGPYSWENADVLANILKTHGRVASNKYDSSIESQLNRLGSKIMKDGGYIRIISKADNQQDT